jgi:hypothetical protein
MTSLEKIAADPTADEVAEIMRQVIVGGDLARLSPVARMQYYSRVCESVGLNPLTKPFEFIPMKADGGTTRLVLYATKSATDQLRMKYGISVVDVRVEVLPTQIVATAIVSDRTGRTDADVGVVATEYYHFKRRETVKLGGEELANARMKAVTKAKRRATLSFCGLGMLDESEVEAMVSNSRPVDDEVASVAAEIGAPATVETVEAEPVESDRLSTFDRWMDGFAVRHRCKPAVAGQVLTGWLRERKWEPTDLADADTAAKIKEAIGNVGQSEWDARIDAAEGGE